VQKCVTCCARDGMMLQQIAALMNIWRVFLVVLLCRHSAAALPSRAQHSFAVAFAAPSDSHRVSNSDALTLSWTCAPLALGSSPSRPPSHLQSPTLVLSIHNEIVHKQVLFVVMLRTSTR
jgi:hypothetical protein